MCSAFRGAPLTKDSQEQDLSVTLAAVSIKQQAPQVTIGGFTYEHYQLNNGMHLFLEQFSTLRHIGAVHTVGYAVYMQRNTNGEWKAVKYGSVIHKHGCPYGLSQQQSPLKIEGDLQNLLAEQASDLDITASIQLPHDCFGTGFRNVASSAEVAEVKDASFDPISLIGDQS